MESLIVSALIIISAAVDAALSSPTEVLESTLVVSYHHKKNH